MKRIIALSLVFVMLFAFTACKEKDEYDTSYPSRTAAFYGNMNPESFYFAMRFTNNGATYDFAQATNGKTVTTLEDHSDNSYDKYHIYDGSCVHKLDLSAKKYDTLVGPKGQEFIFGGYTSEMFNSPSSAGVGEFEGQEYYCESFVTAGSGRNNYYYDGYDLKVIEIIENGKTVMVMRIKEFSNTIPDDVYLSIPSGFKAGQLEYEAPDVSFDDSWIP